MKEDTMNIGEKLKSVRKSQGLSLKVLAEKTGISVSFLSDVENGRSNPSIDNLKLISVSLNTSVSYFVDDSVGTTFDTLVNNVDMLPLIELLQDFKEWELEDKKELMYYLRAKKCIRDSK